jgi:hypothetical protein
MSLAVGHPVNGAAAEHRIADNVPAMEDPQLKQRHPRYF